MTGTFRSRAEQYRAALLGDILPFWQQHSLDREHGGYFTCLDRRGEVYDTDKFVWLQARQVWLFSMLYNRLEKDPAWLAVARSGAEFLRRHGRDGAGNWYFSLTAAGEPLVQPYNIFSDCFAAMAMSQFALASGDNEARQIAQNTYQNILRRIENPKGTYSKIVPGTRPLRSFALPMILSNVALEMEWMLEPPRLEKTLDASVGDIMGLHYDGKRRLLFENVAPDGSHIDSFDGRLINPGHGIEATWFMMDIARRRGDVALAARATEALLSTCAFGWDEKHGGIFYYLDSGGHPPDQLAWDQKLWWVHAEALVALSLAFALTGEPECLTWFDRVHQYTWQNFPDPECGEWYGYLNRRGEVLLPLKGGKWKGCFHIPRALYLCMNTFNELADRHE
jgi:N-acylglucosamine 2-epimerase